MCKWVEGRAVCLSRAAAADPCPWGRSLLMQVCQTMVKVHSPTPPWFPCCVSRLCLLVSSRRAWPRLRWLVGCRLV